MTKPKANARPASTFKVRDICLAKAIASIRAICREEEPDGAGAKVISDLATWEIEARIVNAVTQALKDLT